MKFVNIQTIIFLLEWKLLEQFFHIAKEEIF